MKRLLKYLPILLLVSGGLLADEYPENCQSCATSIYLPRPQGLFSASGMNSVAFWNPWYYKCCDGSIDTCASYNVGFRFDQTWDGKRLAQCLFDADQNGTVNMRGSLVPASSTLKQLIADDYGLSPYMTGSFTLNPRIQNYNVDFAGRWELGYWHDCFEGLYFGLAATLAHSSWDLNYCENAFEITQGQPNDLFQCESGTVTEPAMKDIQTALEMKASFGLLAQSEAQYGKFVLNRAQNLTALANIDMVLGYDFLRCDGHHLGLFLKAVAPTGNRPYTETVFAPVVGNAHHWELGGGLDAHWDVWQCDDHCVSLYLTGSATHLFKDKQKRTADLWNANKTAPSCMSRNILLKTFNQPNETSGYTINQIIRASDWTTRTIESSFDVMGDASLKLMYRNCGWAVGLGYNIYGRSTEKLNLVKDECNASRLKVAIKGNAGVCYFPAEPGAPTQSLDATQSQYQPTAKNTAFPVDNKVSEGDNTSAWDGSYPVDNTNPVVPLTDANIAFTPVPRQIQHTIFGNVDYQWQDCDSQPFMGIGGSCSFAQNGSCNVCTANQWNVWIHGGMTF